MKKYIVLSVCVIVIFALLSGCNREQGNEREAENMSIEDIRFEKSGEVNFQLVGSYMVDTSVIREYFMINEGAPFTFFEQGRAFADYAQFALREYELDLSEIEFNADDHQDKYIVVTIGREILEMQYESIGEGWTIVRAEVTFAEEYNAGIVYVYVMDQIQFFSSVVGNSMYFSFYIMSGTERILEGECIDTLNAQNEEFKREFRERHEMEVSRMRTMGSD